MAKITIFGLAGTGKTSAGKILAEKLSYRFLSTGNMFREVASDRGISLFELEEIAKTDDAIDKELDIKVEKFGKENDNFVFESRLAWHFIPDSLKISFICDLDTRIKRIADREHKDFEKAKSETLLREKAIFERFKNYYGIDDVSDPKNFDIQIDTTKNNLEKVVEIMMDFLKSKGIN